MPFGSYQNDVDIETSILLGGTVPMDGVVKFIWYELPPTEPLY